MLTILLLGVLGGLGFLAWERVTSAPVKWQERRSLRELFDGSDRAPQQRTKGERGDREMLARRVQQMLDQLLREFPELAREEAALAPEEDGIFLIYQLANRAGGLGLSEELKEYLRDALSVGAFDADFAESLLAGHGDLLAEIEHIAALETRSSRGIPSAMGFIRVTEVRDAAQLLLLKARIAAARGDQAEALRWVSLAGRLGSHLSSVNLIGATATVLTDLNSYGLAFNQLLPTLGKDVDLSAWRSQLKIRDYSAVQFAEILRGEWLVTTQWLLPITLDPNDPDAPPDPEALAQAQAAASASIVSRLPSLSWSELLEGSPFKEAATPPHLSTQSRGLFEAGNVEFDAWLKGYARSATLMARFAAGLQLLEWEQQGKPLDAATLAELPVDPVTGQAFIFDPSSRTLVAPPHPAFETEPLKLPW